jgi:hypothetical protein
MLLGILGHTLALSDVLSDKPQWLVILSYRQETMRISMTVLGDDLCPAWFADASTWSAMVIIL